MDSQHSPQQRMAMLMALIVRNAMEDFHASGNLSNEQMAELNPIIRNGIYTGLKLISAASDDLAVQMRLDLLDMLLPQYWEPPVILDEYQSLLDQ